MKNVIEKVRSDFSVNDPVSIFAKRMSYFVDDRFYQTMSIFLFMIMISYCCCY